jgi:hypothetical protein
MKSINVRWLVNRGKNLLLNTSEKRRGNDVFFGSINRGTAFLAFEEQVHLPQMKRFGLTLVSGWNVAVAATPYVIDETRADNLATIGEMLCFTQLGERG